MEINFHGTFSIDYKFSHKEQKEQYLRLMNHQQARLS